VNAVKSNTAIGTTATASVLAGYRGRFAPSPTGQLHQGSLLAALASWLDARSHGGQWLLRMEDLDTLRIVPGAAEQILATLARMGLVADGPILWQSTRIAAYQAAFDHLQCCGFLYACDCPRSRVDGPYTGHCRDRQGVTAPCAWRLRLPHGSFTFDDILQGVCRYDLSQLGDPIIRRRDGIYAYQLAVVVDDAFQGITHVVRGADLLDSTVWQLALAHALGLPVPRHAHLPVLQEADGSKLAKSRHSLPLDTLQPGPALIQALQHLSLQPPTGLERAPASEILAWGQMAWDRSRLAGQAAIRLGPVHNGNRGVAY
jgi:glutamyl-Q tRNA(Asp) synthetase